METMTSSEDEINMAEDQDGVNGEEHPPLDISQRKALTQLPKTNHDAAIFKLVRKLRTRYTNILQMIERVLNMAQPTFFDIIPDAMILRNTFQGKGSLLTTSLQTESIAVQWGHITEVAQLLR